MSHACDIDDILRRHGRLKCTDYLFVLYPLHYTSLAAVCLSHLPHTHSILHALVCSPAVTLLTSCLHMPVWKPHFSGGTLAIRWKECLFVLYALELLIHGKQGCQLRHRFQKIIFRPGPFSILKNWSDLLPDYNSNQIVTPICSACYSDTQFTYQHRLIYDVRWSSNTSDWNKLFTIVIQSKRHKSPVWHTVVGLLQQSQNNHYTPFECIK